MNYLIYSLLFFGVVLSGMTVLLFKLNNKALKLILSFSGAFLFAICVLHLIPELYTTGNKVIGVYILIGFFFQILLEFFSKGIEHGHIHVYKHSAKVVLYTVMLSLCIHSFLEAMPLTGASGHAVVNQSLLIGIIMHNIPISITLMSMLLQVFENKRMPIVLLLVFAIMAPLGSYTSTAIGQSLGSLSNYYDYIMAVVIGIFLHISTTILFESTENHRFNFLKFIAIIIGAVVAFLVS